MKRLFDIILSSLGLFISVPVFLVLGLTIFLADGGPVFYIQDRAGKNGRIFKSIKFRSMIKNAEGSTGPVQAAEDDPRVTRIGRMMRAVALDELPQLINILKGDMSFVGPRALRPMEKEAGDGSVKDILSYSYGKERLAVKPGLTGVAQILAPKDIGRSEKFKYDIWYIKNRSIFLDIYLIILSFLVTFLGRWEYRRNKLSFICGGLKARVEKNL